MRDHGTRARYQASGCRCGPCTASNTAYISRLRLRTLHGHPILGRRIPSTDTAKRLKQLLIEKVTRGQIARALGCHIPILRLHTQPGQWITLKNALKMKRLHRLWLGGPVD